MSTTKTKDRPRLTEPQVYQLGTAVQNAYLRHEWDGKAGSKHCPVVRDSNWRGGASVPQIKAMLRTRVISPATNGVHKLTKLGIEIGEEEAVERTGVSPKEQAAENKRAEEERAIEIAELVAPFKGYIIKRKIKHGGQKPKTMDLADVMTEVFQKESWLELSEDEIREIGKQLPGA